MLFEFLGTLYEAIYTHILLGEYVMGYEVWGIWACDSAEYNTHLNFQVDSKVWAMLLLGWADGCSIQHEAQQPRMMHHHAQYQASGDSITAHNHNVVQLQVCFSQ